MVGVRGDRLVLTMTNVTELVAPLKRGRDFLEIRVLLQALERAPVCYLREGYIFKQELQCALEAYRHGQASRAPDPYVVRWDEVIQPPNQSVVKGFVNYRLDEMIYELWKQNALPDHRRQTKQLNALFRADRNLPVNVRRSLDRNFAETVKKNLQLYKVSASASETEDQPDYGDRTGDHSGGDGDQTFEAVVGNGEVFEPLAAADMLFTIWSNRRKPRLQFRSGATLIIRPENGSPARFREDCADYPAEGVVRATRKESCTRLHSGSRSVMLDYHGTSQEEGAR